MQLGNMILRRRVTDHAIEVEKRLPQGAWHRERRRRSGADVVSLMKKRAGGNKEMHNEIVSKQI